jgi:GT2 family glycosyltransferase
MADPVNQIAIVIASHNGLAYLDDCLASVLASADPGTRVRVVVVDDASTDGTPAHLTARWGGRIDLVPLRVNVGFAAANNEGWLFVRRQYPQTQYLVLLNQDTIVAPGWLGPMLAYLTANQEIGIVQPKILLHPQTDRINTAGNRSHFLGLGYCEGYGQVDRGQYDRPRPIDYASGAALMVRAHLVSSFGLFEPLMVAYLEDADLAWKLRIYGWTAALVPQSVVYHRYQPQNKLAYYYHLEKNRWWMLFTYYHMATLLLLLPALTALELGQWLFALTGGLLGQKLRSYLFFFSAQRLGLLLARRHQIQFRRRLTDRQFLSHFSGTFTAPGLRHPLWRFCGNPLLNLYWQMVRWLIFW